MKEPAGLPAAGLPAAGRLPPALDFGHLRAFVAVAEELHFARAAQRLNMTQPPHSRQIQVLERTLGVSLLARTSRSVRLTVAGGGFLAEARRILHLAEAAAATARRLAAGQAGTVRLAFTAGAAYDALPRLLAACRDRIPDLHVELHERVSRAATDALLSRACDLALLRPPVRSADLAACRIGAEPMVLAAPADHPLATGGPLPVRDLADVAFIAYRPDEARYFHDLVRRIVERAGIEPAIVHEVAQIHSMLALVRAGLGVALVPAGAASLRPVATCFRPVASHPSDRAELLLAWRRDADHPAVETVAALARGLAGTETP